MKQHERYKLPNRLGLEALRYLDNMGGKVPEHNKFGKQLWWDLFMRGYIIRDTRFLADGSTVNTWERYGVTISVLSAYRDLAS